MRVRVAVMLFGGLTLGLLAVAAHAEQSPFGDRYDTRMRSVAYNPGAVVHLSTLVGNTMVVSFAPTETVTAVAETDTLHLAAVPKGNYLFLKPSAALLLQPVIVLTERPDGSLRRYVFDIETVNPGAAGSGSNSVYYSVEFTYPADVAAARAATARAEAARTAALNRAAFARAQETATTAILNSERTDPTIGPRNYDYVGQGDRSLEPAAVWDNGYSTVFEFSGSGRIPSVFVIDPDGKEATANYSVMGDTVQVGVTAREFRLRDGHTVLNVYNLGFNTLGPNPETGTTSPEVMRVVKSDRPSLHGGAP
jgi:type IV secretion system protein VirB9